MPKINYDIYSKKWWLKVENQHTPLTFEQLEAFSAELQQICSEEYSRALQADLFDDGGTCDGCTI